jgi:hypothetical protein
MSELRKRHRGPATGRADVAGLRIWWPALLTRVKDNHSVALLSVILSLLGAPKGETRLTRASRKPAPLSSCSTLPPVI